MRCVGVSGGDVSTRARARRVTSPATPPPNTINSDYDYRRNGAVIRGSRAANGQRSNAERGDDRSHGFAWVWVAVLAGHLLGVLAISAWLLR